MSARLALRPFTADDAPAVAALAGDPGVADTMISIPHPLSAAGAEGLLATYARDAATGWAHHAAVCRAEDGVLVGGVALRDIDSEHRTAELSFWVGRPWWGRGYAPEAGALALAVAFGSLGLNRVAAYHMVRNAASGAVLRKLGFRREGLLEERVYKAGRFEDVLAYAVLRRDYHAARQGPDRGTGHTRMAPDFDAALARAARELGARADVVALLFFGSAARGAAGAGSDVDLYAVTRGEAHGHLGRVVDGVPVEVSFGSGAQWRARLGRELPAVVHAFATGRVLRDETGGELDALRAGAAALWARGPSAPPPEALLARRFHLTEHLRDLDGLPERGAATALAGAECVRGAVELFCAARRVWLPPARRAVDALAPHDPAFSAAVAAAAEAGFPRTASGRVAAAALEPVGGPLTDYDSTGGGATQASAPVA